MSQAPDKKLWLLEEEDKLLLLQLAETMQSIRSKDAVSEIDFGGMDDLQDQAFQDWMQLKPNESTYPVKLNLLFLAAHCLRIIKKLQ